MYREERDCIAETDAENNRIETMLIMKIATTLYDFGSLLFPIMKSEFFDAAFS